MPDIHLVVHEPFDGFARGDHITDAETIRRVLDSGHAAFVRAIAAPPPEPPPHD